MNSKAFAEYVTALTDVKTFVGKAPASSVDVAIVVNNGGEASTDLVGFDGDEIQVLTRGSTYLSAEEIATRIYKALHMREDVVIGDSIARSIVAMQKPFFIGYEPDSDTASPQVLFSTNYRVDAHDA